MNLLSRSLATPSTGLYPVGEVGSGTGWFSDGTGPTGSPARFPKKSPGALFASALPPVSPSPSPPPIPPPPASLRPLEQRKVTFVSTRSRLSNEEPRRLHSCDRTPTLWSTVNTLFPNRFGYDCRLLWTLYSRKKAWEFLWLLIRSNHWFSIRKLRITQSDCV